MKSNAAIGGFQKMFQPVVDCRSRLPYTIGVSRASAYVKMKITFFKNRTTLQNAGLLNVYPGLFYIIGL